VSSSDNTSFEALPLSRALLANLPSLGYERMTPIQAQSLPRTLEGSDLLALAKTGSGKTAAFSLPLLMRLEAARRRWC
jgi:ATP-independent RNA helicase DbpA